VPCGSASICQLARLEQETVRWCREILRNSPTAVRVLKSALNAIDDGHAGLQVRTLGVFGGFLARFVGRQALSPSLVYRIIQWRGCSHSGAFSCWRLDARALLDFPDSPVLLATAPSCCSVVPLRSLRGTPH